MRTTSALTTHGVAAILAAALSFGSGWAGGPAAAQAQAAPQATFVHVDQVREEPLAQTAPVVGRLVACRAGVLASRVSGPVAEINAEVGDRITKGGIVAVLDQKRALAERDLQAARVAEAQAALGAAKAEVNLRRQELDRLEGLRRSPAFSKGQFSDKQQEVAMATGEVAKAEAALASARAELRVADLFVEHTEIRAPYDAAVTQRHTEVGAYVDPGAPIVSLVDDHCLEIEVDIPQFRVVGLKPGMTVRFTLDGQSGTARVRAIVPQENALTRTRTARFVPQVDDLSGLAANQSVTIEVPAGSRRDVLTVPKDAVIARGGGSVVFVVEDGKAELRSVRLGEAVGNHFEVLDGLTKGDTVVVRGNERLRPGQAVTYRPDSDAPPGPDSSGSGSGAATRDGTTDRARG